MNGAHAVLRTLVGCGVDVCFMNPGTSEMHFVAALDGVPEGEPHEAGLLERQRGVGLPVVRVEGRRILRLSVTDHEPVHHRAPSGVPPGPLGPEPASTQPGPTAGREFRR